MHGRQGLADIVAALPVSARTPGIAFEWSDKPLKRKEVSTTFGGALTKTGSADYCTTGFSMKNTSTGSDGFVTAGHCGVATKYVDPTNGTLYSVTLGKVYSGTMGDFAYYSVTGNSSLPYFYASPTTRRDITAIMSEAGIDQGDTYCVFGRWTGQQKCAVVKNSTYACGDLWQMVRMDRDVTVGGDSGAPWFTGNTGVGVHFGDCGSYNIFSKLLLADNTLGSNYQVLLN